jgi:hypothetical protein
MRKVTITTFVFIIIIALITPLSICLMGNIHSSQTVGGVRLSQRKEIHPNPTINWHILRIYVPYNMFVTVLLFAPLLRLFWLNLYSLDILGSF